MFKPENRDLERVLDKHLERVSARDDITNELWQRVEIARNARSRPVSRTAPAWPVWATAVATVALVAGGTAGWMMWPEQERPLTMEEMAVEALAKGNGALRFQSKEATEIRNWLRSNADIDIPIPPLHSAMVEIEGADVLQGSDQHGTATVAEISYKVGDHRATLLVTKDPSGKRTYPRHEVRPSESFQDARVSTWSMRGQSYTLAWAAPGEFRVACLLCHGKEPTLMN